MKYYYRIALPLGACVGWAFARLMADSGPEPLSDLISLGLVVVWAYVGVKLDQRSNRDES